MLVSSKSISPAKLSHYTTLDGIVGIITSGRIRASNVLFLNDKSELSHALGAARQAIAKLSSENTMRQWSPMLERVIAELEGAGYPDTFVICFSKDADNLSQWRGYGGAIQGVSLTFDRQKMSNRLKRDGAEFFEIKYSKLSTATKLSEELRSSLGRLADLGDLAGDMSDGERYEKLRDRVSALLPRFKHLGFKDEREWRYSIQRKVGPESLCFRVSNNKLVPYIMVGESEDLLPIVGATVGPGPDQELTRRSVSLFLKSKGYDVPIVLSEVPFRS